MNLMQNEFSSSALAALKENQSVVLIFFGAGIVDQSRFDSLKERQPERIVDFGIAEQAGIGFAAGLAIAGKIPIIHTHTAFLIERAYEQIKIDFGYQNLGCNLIGLGGSLEFTFLGPTHNCPSDVPILKLIPNMEIVVPGTVEEFRILFRSHYDNGKPTYFRLSRELNSQSYPVIPYKAHVIKKGKKATIIVIGPMLNYIFRSIAEEDVTILYYTSVSPFDCKTLIENFVNNRIMIIEPYFSGSLLNEIHEALKGESIKLASIGVPVKFFTEYGLTQELESELGLESEQIRKKFRELLS